MSSRTARATQRSLASKHKQKLVEKNKDETEDQAGENCWETAVRIAPTGCKVSQWLLASSKTEKTTGKATSQFISCSLTRQIGFLRF